jgi:hypothetical protein
MAQGSNFVYLQTEPQEPFYVKINGDLLSSSASGYLIVSRLTDSIYPMSIGFPENKWKEQQYRLPVYKAGTGYVLRFSSEKGWALVDLKTREIINSIHTDAEKIGKPAKQIQSQKQELDVAIVKKEKENSKPTESFASLLAKASGDEELLTPVQSRVDSAASVSIASASPKTNADTIVVAKKIIVADPPVVKVEEIKKIDSVDLQKELAAKVSTASPMKKDKTDFSSVISKTAESSTTEGFGLQYVDKFSSGQVDTIQLLIPNQKQTAEVVKSLSQNINKGIDSFIHCNSLASYDDFISLEKNMKAAQSDVEKAAFAKKTFAAMCFNCEQIKRLSLLIENLEVKYNFFLDAYQATSNRSAFGAMLNELNEKEIAERFKLLLY